MNIKSPRPQGRASDGRAMGALRVALFVRHRSPRRPGLSYVCLDVDAHLHIIAHFTDDISYVNGGLVCQMLFRHVTHTQAIMVLDNDALMVVAAPGTSLTSPRHHLGALYAFHLRA